MAQELRNEFIFDALEARKRMYKIMTDTEAQDKDVISVAKDFLDRGGFKPTDKTEIDLNGDVTINVNIEE